MNRRFLGFLFLLLLFCGGCGKTEKQNTVRVVTSIEITATRDGRLLRRSFTDSGDMHAILQYLRKLDPYTATELSPDSFRTDAYQIRVIFSDGTQAVYRQIYDRYFQVPDGSWRVIDPRLGDLLSDFFDVETACIL